MNGARIFRIVVAAGVIGAAGYGLYWSGMRHGMQMSALPMPAASQASQASAASPAPAAGKKILYWHDPMVPGHRFDKPGKSPFMDMQLVPVYAESSSPEGGVAIDPRVQQNLGVRTAVVTTGAFETALEAVGTVAYDERGIVAVQARSNGFVEKLHVRATLDPVRKGQPLADLYVPEWVAAQEEYLAVRRMGAGVPPGLLEAASGRMRLAGMTEEQIRLVASRGTVQARITLTAPVAGVVTDLSVREGMSVAVGAALFRINGLATVWMNAELPENAAAAVRPGTPVEVRSAALPGSVFKGKVGAILPEINPVTRTLRARIDIANPAGQLIPGMFATVQLTAPVRREVLTVPSEALIRTGKRNIVMVAQDEGHFAPATVETGAEANGRTEILKGLEAGQKVVVSGQFLIDSEASLRGATMGMESSPTAAGPERAGAPAGAPGASR